MNLRSGAAAIGVTLVLVITACGEPGNNADAVDATTASAAADGETVTDPGAASSGTPTSAATLSDAMNREERPVPTVLPEPVADADDHPVAGEAPPEVIAAVVADLAGRTGIGTEMPRVVAAADVVWADGSLGCATTGEIYLPVPTAGWQIVLEEAGTEYDYRVTESGFFKLCGTGNPHPGR